jgi:hypothetical protein
MSYWRSLAEVPFEPQAHQWVRPTDAKPPAYANGFYDKLSELLTDSAVSRIHYRGLGDIKTLKMLTKAQALRAARSGSLPELALVLTVQIEGHIDHESWGGFLIECKWQDCDLFIDGRDLMHACAPPGVMVEVLGNRPGRYLLSTRDEGAIEGFSRDAGDECTVYRSALMG